MQGTTLLNKKYIDTVKATTKWAYNMVDHDYIKNGTSLHSMFIKYFLIHKVQIIIIQYTDYQYIRLIKLFFQLHYNPNWMNKYEFPVK